MFAPSTTGNVEVLIVSVEQVAPAAVVQVPVPDAESKMTASLAVGTEAPGAPPDVADQFRTFIVFHVPEPPTQYLFAIWSAFLKCQKYQQTNLSERSL
jgi:hypothetical protein